MLLFYFQCFTCILDKNDFLSNSGWFSHGAMALGRDAHYHCLARKADMNYDRFMSIKEAIYLLQYMNEKVIAEWLLYALCSYFITCICQYWFIGVMTVHV